MKQLNFFLKIKAKLLASPPSFYYIMVPMKVSESIEAHLCSAVAAIAQRNQATLSGKVSGHPIFLSFVFNRLYRLAKAFGFCLYFYPDFHYTASNI
jgi:hypothetical protein